MYAPTQSVKLALLKSFSADMNMGQKARRASSIEWKADPSRCTREDLRGTAERYRTSYLFPGIGVSSLWLRSRCMIIP